jgi:hypothetical protein
MSDELKKKRGRPPLSPEMKAVSKSKKQAYNNAYKKAHGYVSQKKYHSMQYEPKIRVPVEKKKMLIDLLATENSSLTGMFVSLVKEKYGIDLS